MKQNKQGKKYVMVGCWFFSVTYIL